MNEIPHEKKKLRLEIAGKVDTFLDACGSIIEITRAMSDRILKDRDEKGNHRNYPEKKYDD